MLRLYFLRSRQKSSAAKMSAVLGKRRAADAGGSIVNSAHKSDAREKTGLQRPRAQVGTHVKKSDF